jgi:cardiolipin synthase A/B
VHVVVDGFGSLGLAAALRRMAGGRDGVRLEVFRPLDRWWSLAAARASCGACTRSCAWSTARSPSSAASTSSTTARPQPWLDSEQPRLDFAVRLRGPVALQVAQTARAIWTRAQLGQDWRDEELRAGAQRRAVGRTLRRLLQAAAHARRCRARLLQAKTRSPVRVAFVVRDNLRQRRAIERSYIEAIRGARRIDLACPTSTPAAPSCARCARRAVACGCGCCCRARSTTASRRWPRACCTTSCCATACGIYEYTPAFLHAKVAVVDDDWATVGSSNIDPLSLLLNLEANAVVSSSRTSAAPRWACRASSGPTHAPLGRADLTVARERNQRLHTHAAPVMEMLHDQIVGTESMVVLCDATGTIIHSIGDDDFLARLQGGAAAGRELVRADQGHQRHRHRADRGDRPRSCMPTSTTCTPTTS